MELWDVRTGRARSTSFLYEAKHPIVWVTSDPVVASVLLALRKGLWRSLTWRPASWSPDLRGAFEAFQRLFP